MASNEEMIENIKYIARKNGFAYCYNMPIPDNVSFYALEYKLNRFLILTNYEMDKYFFKYPKWKDFFFCYEPYYMKHFYVIPNDEIKDFLLAEYKKRIIKEQLGKIYDTILIQDKKMK